MSSSRKLSILVSLVTVSVLLLAAPTAKADWITPPSITDSSTLSPGGQTAALAIDNDAGTYCKLPDDSATGPCTGYIIFDLGTKQEVDGFKFWPRNHPSATTCPESVDFLYFVNDTVGTYSATSDLPLDSNVVVAASRILPAIHGSTPDEEVFTSGEKFSGRYVGLRMNSSYDGEGTGAYNQLAEVQFNTSPVPEPSTVIVLATSLIGLFCYAWRKGK
jgi:hypothetical protein